MRRLIFILAILSFSLIHTVEAKEVDAKTETTCNEQQSEKCANCSYASQGSSSSGTSQIIVLTILVAMVSLYFYSKKRKKLYLFLGSAGVVVLLGSSLISKSNEKDVSCAEFSSNTTGEFKSAGDEFIALDEGGGDDEFKSVDDEFSNIGEDEFKDVSDEFSEPDNDEFASVDSSKEIEQQEEKGFSKADINLLIELGILLILSIIVGLLINNTQFQKMRPVFLIGTMVWLGFMKGGCPCMISSFQNLILAISGVNVKWISLLWFLGLIPVTYFLGRVWCGWLCHLGALQEFIFSSTKLDFLKEPKHQKLLRVVQILFFVILILQIFITKTNIYIHYDPFKVAFNMFSANVTGYVLLAVLLLSSVLVYRPFCRSVCPVGLVLGWVSLLPGARKITQDSSCVDCVKCSRECKSHALIYVNKKSVLHVSDCIACGECLDSCNKGALSIISSQKNKTKKSEVES